MGNSRFYWLLHPTKLVASAGLIYKLESWGSRFQQMCWLSECMQAKKSKHFFFSLSLCRPQAEGMVWMKGMHLAWICNMLCPRLTLNSDIYLTWYIYQIPLLVLYSIYNILLWTITYSIQYCVVELCYKTLDVIPLSNYLLAIFWLSLTPLDSAFVGYYFAFYFSEAHFPQ